MKSWCFYFFRRWDLSFTVSHTYAWARIAHPIFCMGNIMKRTDKKKGRAFILSGICYLPGLLLWSLFTLGEIPLTNALTLFTFFCLSTLHPHSLWETPSSMRFRGLPRALEHLHTPAMCLSWMLLPFVLSLSCSWFSLARSPQALCLSSHMFSRPCPEVTTLESWWSHARIYPLPALFPSSMSWSYLHQNPVLQLVPHGLTLIYVIKPAPFVFIVYFLHVSKYTVMSPLHHFNYIPATLFIF